MKHNTTHTHTHYTNTQLVLTKYFDVFIFPGSMAQQLLTLAQPVYVVEPQL